MLRKLTKILIAISLLVTPLLSAAPALAATSVSITSPTNGSTATGTSFAVTGTATPARNISVKVNGAVVGTTTSDGSGNWSLSVTGQTAGAKTIEATASYRELYLNSVNGTGGFIGSVMTKINPIDDSIEGTFSTFADSKTFLFWKANNSFSKAYGTSGPLNSSLVYVINLASESVSTFTQAGVGARPTGVDFNASGTKVYIGDLANDVVRVYDTTTDAEIGTGIAVGDGPYNLSRRPGTDEIWVPNINDNTISVIDASSDTVINTYPATAPVTVIFNEAGTKAYVVRNANNTIYELNASTGALIGTITTTGFGYSPMVNHSGTRLYVPHLLDTGIDVIDTSSYGIIQTITAGTGPISLAITDDDSKMYAANANAGAGFSGTTVSVIDATDNTVTSTFNVASAPALLAFAPIESASASVFFTLASASSSSSLASTGQDTRLAIIAALIFIMIGAGGITTVVLKKGSN